MRGSRARRLDCIAVPDGFVAVEIAAYAKLKDAQARPGLSGKVWKVCKVS